MIVVNAASPLKSMKDLVDAFKADPGKVSWAGGSAGGTDHILAGMIAKALGVEAKRVSYVAYSGGGPAQAALLGNQVTCGISGYGEFAEQIKAGKLRALAISADKRMDGIDIPTLKEQGIDVELANWRGVFGRAGAGSGQAGSSRRPRRQDGEGPDLAGRAQEEGLDRHLSAGRRLRQVSSTARSSASPASSRTSGSRPDRLATLACARTIPAPVVEAVEGSAAMNDGNSRRGPAWGCTAVGVAVLALAAVLAWQTTAHSHQRRLRQGGTQGDPLDRDCDARPCSARC